MRVCARRGGALAFLGPVRWWRREHGAAARRLLASRALAPRKDKAVPWWHHKRTMSRALKCPPQIPISRFLLIREVTLRAGNGDTHAQHVHSQPESHLTTRPHPRGGHPPCGQHPHTQTAHTQTGHACKRDNQRTRRSPPHAKRRNSRSRRPIGSHSSASPIAAGPTSYRPIAPHAAQVGATPLHALLHTRPRLHTTPALLSTRRRFSLSDGALVWAPRTRIELALLVH